VAGDEIWDECGGFGLFCQFDGDVCYPGLKTLYLNRTCPVGYEL